MFTLRCEQCGLVVILNKINKDLSADLTNPIVIVPHLDEILIYCHCGNTTIIK